MCVTHHLISDETFDLEQDCDGDGFTLMIYGILVAVEPGVVVVQLCLHVQLHVVDGVLAAWPVQVYKRQRVVAALKVNQSRMGFNVNVYKGRYF